ncbi:MAG TPA: DUF167 family protein [Casimicrobiaceae bacterium]|nr:DUF167 family protein [Casimicrobiaceae bacterium]
MTTQAWRRDADDGSITLQIQAHPGAKSTTVVGVHGEGSQARLKIALAAPPVDGKANAALRAFLADAFGVAQGNVTLLRGKSGRRKLVRIEAPTRRPDSDWG